MITGQQAAELGIANHVVADELLMETALNLAAKIAAKPPIAVKLIRRTVYQSQNIDLKTALDLVASHMGVVMMTQDHQEALAAFREKRPGNFQGR